MCSVRCGWGTCCNGTERVGCLAIPLQQKKGKGNKLWINSLNSYIIMHCQQWTRLGRGTWGSRKAAGKEAKGNRKTVEKITEGEGEHCEARNSRFNPNFLGSTFYKKQNKSRGHFRCVGLVFNWNKGHSHWTDHWTFQWISALERRCSVQFSQDWMWTQRSKAGCARSGWSSCPTSPVIVSCPWRYPATFSSCSILHSSSSQVQLQHLQPQNLNFSNTFILYYNPYE